MFLLAMLIRIYTLLVSSLFLYLIAAPQISYGIKHLTPMFGDNKAVVKPTTTDPKRQTKRLSITEWEYYMCLWHF